MKGNLYWKYESKCGEMIVAINNEGALKGLWFVGQKHFPKIDLNDLQSSDSTRIDKKAIEARKVLFNQLRDYEKGKLKEFSILIDPKGTEFQKEVWKILLTIPYGKTMTYGEISQRIASVLDRETMYAQAVGQAVGRNPISIIIPCHRVVGKKGQLTGYAGGIHRKKALLHMESGILR